MFWNKPRPKNHPLGVKKGQKPFNPKLLFALMSSFLGLDLFQNMFHNLLIYTNNFCFGYIAVSCFFETFPGGWVGGWKI